MANSVIYDGSRKNASAKVASSGEGAAVASFNAKGYAEIDKTDANLIDAVQVQGGVVVDIEGTEEAVVDGTKATATTMTALVLRNGAALSIVNVKEEDTNGTVLIGPITIAANAERVFVFPTQITTANGTDAIFIETPTGALHATPGFLIP